MSDQEQADQAGNRAPSAEQPKNGPDCYVSGFADEGATSFQKAFREAFPFGCTHRQAAAYFDNRAALETVKQWRLGRRQPPQWALELMRAKLARAHTLAMQATPGNHEAAGARALHEWRKKRRAPGA